MVENLVGYAKRDLIVPQAPSLADLADTAEATWCAEVNHHGDETFSLTAEFEVVQTPGRGAAPLTSITPFPS
jgi:hypothetical protein